MTAVVRRSLVRWPALLVALMLAACQSPSTPKPTKADSGPSAPAVNTPGPLFYTKGGSLYASAPAGSPGRKLTDGPADAQPAPAPDLSQVAFVRKGTAFDHGGELWVLDLSPQLEPVGPPRRLVDPAALPPTRVGPTMVTNPRWSPTGDRVAFLGDMTGGGVSGGILLVAAADTGVLEPRQVVPGAEWAPFAGPGFAWSPDGAHIAWLNHRSDVRPTNVNILAAVGGDSTPAVTETNASSVTYASDGQAILFTNGEAPPDNVSRPFAVRTGGIYSVATPGGAATNPPSRPAPLFTRQGSHYGGLTVLDSGAMAFAEGHIDNPSITIQILDPGSTVPRTTVTDVITKPICYTSPSGAGSCYGVTPPAWGTGDFLAYIDNSPGRSLVVTDPDNRDPRRVDTGVDSFAWAPPSR